MKKYGLMGLALAMLLLTIVSEVRSQVGYPAVSWPAESRPGLESEDLYLANFLLVDPRGTEGNAVSPPPAAVKATTKVAATAGAASKTVTQPPPAPSRTAVPNKNAVSPNRGEIGKVNSVLATARHFLGVPYVYGGESPSGFDCSGFTQYVFDQHGVKLPRSSQEQAQVGTRVTRAELAPGDLVFFNTEKSGKINHVGIYIGDNKFIHASRTSGIVITSLTNSYYRDKMAAARRVLR